MLALSFASVVSVLLLVARIIQTRDLGYGTLIWNLFLAWLPLVFALFACEQSRKGGKTNWRLWTLAGAWLLFFPNAPYIFTDLIHLTARFYRHFWVDMVLILMCALTGLVIGFLSLYLMQTVVTRLFGRLTSWIFIAVSVGLGSFGIYLGRFLRLNSWDVITQPVKLYHDIGSWTNRSGYFPTSVGFPILFAAFLFIAYLMLYALTHLSPAPHTSSPQASVGTGEV